MVPTYTAVSAMKTTKIICLPITAWNLRLVVISYPGEIFILGVNTKPGKRVFIKASASRHTVSNHRHSNHTDGFDEFLIWFHIVGSSCLVNRNQHFLSWFSVSICLKVKKPWFLLNKIKAKTFHKVIYNSDGNSLAIPTGKFVFSHLNNFCLSTDKV